MAYNLNSLSSGRQIAGMYIWDSTQTGNGFSGQFRIAEVADFGSLLYTSGVTVTGVVNNEQVTQIAGTGNIDTAHKVIVTPSGQIYVVATQTGTWNINTVLPNARVGITGSNGIALDILTASGFNGIPVFLASGDLEFTNVGLNVGSQVGITGDSIVILKTGVVETQFTNQSIAVGQSGTWTINQGNNITGIQGGIYTIGITGQNWVQVSPSGSFQIAITGNPLVTANLGNNISGTVTANLGTNSQIGITGQTLVQIINSGSVTFALTGNPLVTVNQGNNITGTLIAGTVVGLSGDSTVILKTGVISIQEVGGSSSSLTALLASGVNQQLLAINTNRKAFTIWNNGDTNMYVRLGTPCSLSGFSFVIATGGLYESPLNFYNGRIDSIWQGTPGGSGLVTEIT